MEVSFKPFEQMTPADYAEIGFMCGLEVHQQLLTETKLFCRCPAGRYSSEYDAEILRHMRPTLSELGEYDGTALMEKKTRKNIYYRIHRDTVCTYEFDDTPPFLIDDRALDITIELCLLFQLNLVGELHISRKQYLDGSIPTGFQRTGIVGVGGWIPFRGRRIGIRQLSIEEDACREVSDVGHDRVYLTDRLGTPLVEVVTEPDMRTPEEVAAVAQLIRRICRSTHKVRRGYGSARQDVNVSVRGGTRCEIKGVPQIWRIPRLVYNEARRQWTLLRIREELHRRGITPQTFQYVIHDITAVAGRLPYAPIQAALAAGHRVKCVVLRGFAGILNTITQEHTTFGKEFSDRVRVIACLTTLPNILHSDMATDVLPARDWKFLRRRTGATIQDTLVLVWGDEQDSACAAEEIMIRAREATEGVPRDTRQPLPDGTTGFERVLPGAERMYPDTDLPPVEISRERVERIRARLSTPVWEGEERYRRLGVPEDTVTALSISPRAELFDRLVDELGIDPKLAAVTLVQRLKALRREGLNPDRLTDEEIREVFAAYVWGRISREGIALVLEKVLRLPTDSASGSRVQRVLESLGPVLTDNQVLRAEIQAALERSSSRGFATTEKRFRYLMGHLMRRLGGRVSGAHLAELLAELLHGGPLAARVARAHG